MMRRPQLSPRKTATQERSRATVEAVLEAAADILVRDGYAKLTTNRIAERAGVDIASLYQYFPGKDAIVAELRRRHGIQGRAAIRKALIDQRGQNLESTLRALISMAVAAHADTPRLHHAFTEEMPVLRYSDLAAEDPSTFAEFRRFLETSAVGVPDLDLAQWLVATATGAVIHRAIVERPDDVASGRITEELVTLLLGYLRRR
jgi:AcrR family transcriptional regulator